MDKKLLRWREVLYSLPWGFAIIGIPWVMLGQLLDWAGYPNTLEAMREPHGPAALPFIGIIALVGWPVSWACFVGVRAIQLVEDLQKDLKLHASVGKSFADKVTQLEYLTFSLRNGLNVVASQLMAGPKSVAAVEVRSLLVQVKALTEKRENDIMPRMTEEDWIKKFEKQ